MPLLLRVVGLVCILVSVSGCTAEVDAPPRTEGREQTVVYGADDRQDYYASGSELFRQRTRESIVALIPNSALDRSNPNDIQIVAPTLQSAYDLCDDQRFLEQPTAANCSATLIDDDLVLTAGHCVTSNADCRSYAYVFDYYYAALDDLESIGADDVYTCQELVVQALGGGLDYAILQLDRPVVGGHAPAPVRRDDVALAVGASVPVIGFGSGLPAKIDLGGTVRNGRATTLDYFVTTNDTFGGNSGSGVFDAAGEVVGILVRGETDYVSRGACDIVNTLPDPPGFGVGEEVSYVARALEDLCEAERFPSARLCGGPTGEGWCDPCELASDCPDGWACRALPDLSGLYCALGCDSPDDCRLDHSCTGGFCQPNRTPRCSEGDVWQFDVCGRRVVLADDCDASEVCQGGVCLPRPAGDSCANPTGLTAVTQTVTGDLASYFADATGSCAGDGPERVYTFTVTEDVRFEAVATGFDTVLHLRQTCADSSSELACDDDSNPPGGRGSRFVVNLTPGSYFLFMDAWNDTVGSYTLALTFDYDFTPPEGDTCSAPTPISPVTQRLSGDLQAGYTGDYRGSCAGDGPERVYAFTLTARTRLVALASGFDTVLFLRTVCTDSTTEVACNDDIQQGEDRRSRLDTVLEPGNYFLFMDAWSQDVATYDLALTFTPVACTPLCELGARRCAGPNVELCSSDANACPTWAVLACGAGTTCQDGACVAVCTNECEAAGSIECVDDSGRRTCGNFDDDACLEWSAPTNCPADEPCIDGLCGCPVDCLDGDRRCNGDTVEQCLGTDALCQTFVPVATCGAGTVCAEGECVSVCPEPCQVGTRRCAADEAVELCTRRADGCSDWVPAGRCAEARECVDGRCEEGCEDTCDEGARRCSEEGGRIEVCEVNEAGCTGFATGPSCDDLGGCEAGECRDGCVDECPLEGRAECVTDEAFRECGDLDEDGCLEWHPTSPCPPTWSCVREGFCEPTCGDDPFEPNNGPDEAVAVELGFGAALAVCPDDEDWFALGLQRDERVVVDLTPLEGGDGEDPRDVEVELYREDERVAADPRAGALPEQVSYRALDDEIVLIRVSSAFDDLADAVYELELALGPPLEDECVPDERRCSATVDGLEKCKQADDGRLVWSDPDLCGTARTCEDGACVGGSGERPDAGDVALDESVGTGVEPRPLAVNDGCGCAASGGPSPAQGGLWALVAGIVLRRRRRR